MGAGHDACSEDRCFSCGATLIREEKLPASIESNAP
jgi:hypothetical protein